MAFVNSRLKRPDICHEHAEDCFGYGECGKCRVLSETYPEGHNCPFRKTRNKRQVEHYLGVRRLSEIGRNDLIQKYNVRDPRVNVWGDIDG